MHWLSHLLMEVGNLCVNRCHFTLSFRNLISGIIKILLIFLCSKFLFWKVKGWLWWCSSSFGFRLLLFIVNISIFLHDSFIHFLVHFWFLYWCWFLGNCDCWTSWCCCSYWCWGNSSWSLNSNNWSWSYWSGNWSWSLSSNGNRCWSLSSSNFWLSRVSNYWIFFGFSSLLWLGGWISSNWLGFNF